MRRLQPCAASDRFDNGLYGCCSRAVRYLASDSSLIRSIALCSGLIEEISYPNFDSSISRRTTESHFIFDRVASPPPGFSIAAPPKQSNGCLRLARPTDVISCLLILFFFFFVCHFIGGLHHKTSEKRRRQTIPNFQKRNQIDGNCFFLSQPLFRMETMTKR